MIKKLLLILALATPLFGQSPSTLAWKGGQQINSGATTERPDMFFIYRDSLWGGSNNGVPSSTTISVWNPITHNWREITDINSYIGNGAYGTLGGNINYTETLLYELGDTLISLYNSYFYVINPGVSNSNDLLASNMWSTTRDTLLMLGSNAGAIWSHTSGTNNSTSETFIINGRPTLYGGDNGDSQASDSAFWQIKYTNVASVMPRTKLTGNFNRNRNLTWETPTTTRDIIQGQAFTGNTVNLLSGKGKTASWMDNPNDSDTLYLLQSTVSPYTVFNVKDTLGLSNGSDEFNINWMGSRDGVTYIIVSTLLEDTTKQGIYWIDEGGLLQRMDPPTNLPITGGFVSDNYFVLFVTNNTNADSNLTYYSDRHNIEWYWIKNPLDVILMQGIEYDNKILVSQGWPHNNVFGFSTTYQGDLDTKVFFLEDLLVLLSPKNNDSFTSTDVPILWQGLDSTIIYYSANSGVNWHIVDTTTNKNYLWKADDIIGLGIDGTVLLKLSSIDSSIVSETSTFYYISKPSLKIIYPINSVGTKNIGDTVHITIATTLVDTLSLFYSINDSLNWIPIAINIATNSTVSIDTLIYIWTLPNINGSIFILATTNPSSNFIENTGRIPVEVGKTISYYPAVCWYKLSNSIIEARWYVDQSCGWNAFTIFEKITFVINDYGIGYDIISESCPYPGQLTCATTNPLYSDPTWMVSNNDTVLTYISDFYPSGDTIVYNLRKYYIGTDSILYADDLYNGIDSLIISDLGLLEDFYLGMPTKLTVYNVQRSKIQNDTLLASTNFESLNDILFEPLLFISGQAQDGRGQQVFAIPLLDKPLDTSPSYDIVQIFEALTLHRSYFRGIDPKARKSGR